MLSITYFSIHSKFPYAVSTGSLLIKHSVACFAIPGIKIKGQLLQQVSKGLW